MTEQRRMQIARLDEDARHIRELLDDDSTAGTELDSLEIEWSARLSEDLPALEEDYRAGDMNGPEREAYERLIELLGEMTPLLRRWRFAEPRMYSLSGAKARFLRRNSSRSLSPGYPRRIPQDPLNPGYRLAREPIGPGTSHSKFCLQPSPEGFP